MVNNFSCKMLLAAVLGTLINFTWEIAHSFLYRGISEMKIEEHLWCCGIAAFHDGIGIALIFVLGYILFGGSNWVIAPSLERIAFVAICGFVMAVVTEQLALRFQWWAYTEYMPRVPRTNLGVTPLIQMILLPPIVLFWLLPKIDKPLLDKRVDT